MTFISPGLQRAEDVDGNFAYFKDKEIIFESAVSSIVSTLQLVWRYGLSLFRMESHTNSFLKDFERWVSGQGAQLWSANLTQGQRTLKFVLYHSLLSLVFIDPDVFTCLSIYHS